MRMTRQNTGRHSRELRRQYWLLIKSGLPRLEAAAELSLTKNTDWRWFHQAGGVIPLHVLQPLSGRYLSITEREEIFAGVKRGESVQTMGRRLVRTPLTVLQ